MSLKKWRIVVLIVLVAISLLIVACSKGEVTDSGTKMESPTDTPTEGTAMGVGEKESKTTTEDTIRHDASKDRAVDENRTSGNQQISAGQLTAGEWNDLRNWDWWVRLLNNKEWAQYQDRWGFYTFKKLQVIVKDGQKTVSDVKVVLYDKQGHVLWSAKTNNKGVAELFTELYDRNQNTVFDLVIENGQNRKKIENVKLSLSEPHYVEFNQRGEESNILDLMFVIDTTGSMHDELDYLKAELKNVILRINEDSADLDIRLSCNYYRDHGDEYVVRSFPFTK
ncbi:hypothetical protein [Alkaliphilus peptidifermentans]|uniref:von Willebrand factor type A domain-containing protein n=1 Tax=Alkaliphilus peptidifermentans DSM 18978 TaxID=1120976 RepID=A0A1G5J7L6_9FIRM|nr:hypothetical protein [Alkaliphilus peptidifermentans]SCY83799.1 hypothetical protein SAMN03080606_02670 [Alkaliphilus peptidifermentans DSM 18978]